VALKDDDLEPRTQQPETLQLVHSSHRKAEPGASSRRVRLCTHEIPPYAFPIGQKTPTITPQKR
jgi:hypothetical protein